MDISILVASAENHVIGINNSLPWRLSDDLKHFRTLTTGHAVLMGRKTFESIGKALPNRRNMVLSRRVDISLPAEVALFHDLPTAIAAAREAQENELFIIGGANVYAQAWEFATKLYWTRVQANPEGDAHFSPPNLRAWKRTNRQYFEASDKNEFAFEIETWEKG